MDKDAAAWQATEELATLQQAHTDLAAYAAKLGRAAASEAPKPAEPPAPKKARRNPKEQPSSPPPTERLG